MFFRDGINSKMTYPGQRDKDSLKNFLEEQMTPKRKVGLLFYYCLREFYHLNSPISIINFNLKTSYLIVSLSLSLLE